MTKADTEAAFIAACYSGLLKLKTPKERGGFRKWNLPLSASAPAWSGAEAEDSEEEGDLTAPGAQWDVVDDAGAAVGDDRILQRRLCLRTTSWMWLFRMKRSPKVGIHRLAAETGSGILVKPSHQFPRSLLLFESSADGVRDGWRCFLDLCPRDEDDRCLQVQHPGHCYACGGEGHLVLKCPRPRHPLGHPFGMSTAWGLSHSPGAS